MNGTSFNFDVNVGDKSNRLMGVDNNFTTSVDLFIFLTGYFNKPIYV
jgi:hypothetical protein